MNAIGYKERAQIYDLEDKLIQNIRCRNNSKLRVSGSFMGGGKASIGQTLELATKTILKHGIYPDGAMQFRVKYNGRMYLLIGLLSHDTAPIKGFIQDIETVLLLQ